jgi:hypothetical protein
MPTPTGAGAQLVALLDEQHAELTALLAAQPAEALDRKGVVGEWSIKNMLAHLAAWELTMVQALDERLVGGKSPEVMATIAASPDEWNAAQVADADHLSPEDQLAELAWTHDVLVQYLRTLDEATLTGRAPWPGWDGTVADYIRATIVEHEREHLAQIRSALQG